MALNHDHLSYPRLSCSPPRTESSSCFCTSFTFRLGGTDFFRTSDHAGKMAKSGNTSTMAFGVISQHIFSSIWLDITKDHEFVPKSTITNFYRYKLCQQWFQWRLHRRSSSARRNWSGPMLTKKPASPDGSVRVQADIDEVSYPPQALFSVCLHR